MGILYPYGEKGGFGSDILERFWEMGGFGSDSDVGRENILSVPTYSS